MPKAAHGVKTRLGWRPASWYQPGLFHPGQNSQYNQPLELGGQNGPGDLGPCLQYAVGKSHQAAISRLSSPETGAAWERLVSQRPAVTRADLP